MIDASVVGARGNASRHVNIAARARSRAQPDFRTSTLKSSPSACTGTRVAPFARACSSAIADCCRTAPRRLPPRHRRARWCRARPSSLVQLVARPPSDIDDRLLRYALEQRAPCGPRAPAVPPRRLLPRARAARLADHAPSRHSCGLRALRAAAVKSFDWPRRPRWSPRLPCSYRCSEFHYFTRPADKRK